MNGTYFKKWSNKGETKAVVLVVHGAAEHHGRYEHVAQWFTERGIAVCAGDLPGLGRSSGLQGHIDSFDQYIQTVDEWVRQTRRYYPDVPLFLVGHSMGGLIVIRYLQEHPERHEVIRGTIVTSPAMRIAVRIPSWKQNLVGTLDRMTPKLRMASGIRPELLSRSMEVVERVKVDPLVAPKVSVHWYVEFQRGIETVWNQFDKATGSILVLQSGEDRIVDPQGTVEFFDKMTESDKTIYLYPSCYHELLQEPERETVFQKMLEWMQERNHE